MRIREYRQDDCASVTTIFVDAVTVTGLRGYSPEQVKVWAASGASDDDTRERCGDGRLVLVAVDDDDRAIAFIDLEDDGHIDMLFCLPEWTGRGIASALYEKLEHIARERGMSRFYVEASEIAKPFFARKGFALFHRNDFDMEGVAVHNYAMEKQLS
jgi:putative acetyltransferase